MCVCVCVCVCITFHVFIIHIKYSEIILSSMVVLCVFVCVCVHACVHTCVCMCVCVCVCVCVCLHVSSAILTSSAENIYLINCKLLGLLHHFDILT